MRSHTVPPGARVEIAGVLLPLLLNARELDAAVRRHAPRRRPEGGRRLVVVSVALDAGGAVVSAHALAGVPRTEPLAGEGRRSSVGEGHGTSFGEREGAAAPDPELAAAAERAARVAHFCPAERGGDPVPYPDYRLTIVFDLSAPERSGVVRARL